jgi:1-acyl-sn-glycerol-3-phosphate acyltransferase
MAIHRIGSFAVDGPAELARTAIGTGALVRLGEPIVSGAVRVLPSQEGHALMRLWAEAVRRFLAIELDSEGLDTIDSDRQYVVAPLHEGFADPLLLAILPLNLRYLVREELFEWRFLGRALRSSRQIAVRPENRVAGYRKLMAEARRTVARGESLVIFPQGCILGVETAFNTGAFRIADRLGLPVLPVVLTGTHRVWEHPYTDRLRFGQKVSLRSLPPLRVGKALELMRATERSMKKLAHSATTAQVRRFDPDRDGFWDGYDFEIDPDYPDLAARLADRRESRADAV